MKKILFVLCLLLILASCSDKSSLSSENTTEYFNKFIEEIKTTTSDFGYNVTEKFTPKTEGKKTITINISEGEYINVNFENLAFKSGKSDKKTFSVDYSIDDLSKKMNMDLFLKICNVISQKELTYEVCTDFLESDEYIVEKSSIEKISKEKYFDFWQNWFLSYTETNLETSSFIFGGYTK